MDGPHIRYGIASAWKIFPLGIVMGLGVMSPLLWYLADSSGGPGAPGASGEEGVSSVVYLVGAFSVVLGALAILLLFLWVCEWVTQESQRED